MGYQAKKRPRRIQKGKRKNLELYNCSERGKSQGKQYKRDVGGIKLHENPAARPLNTAKIQ